MSIQEIFEKVREHLLTQGEAAVSSDNSCMYKMHSGLQCAVGCLISDEAYSEKLEGKMVEMELVQEALSKSGIELSNDVIHMLADLQCMHDDEEVETWPKHLDEIGKRYGVIK